MNRRLMLMPAVALSAALLIAACSGNSATTGPGATSTPAGATAAPTTPPAAGATIAPTEPAVATPGGPEPTLPSFAPDTTLAGEFPATIDGQPVTDVSTGLYIDLLTQFGQSSDDVNHAEAVFSQIGIDLTQLGFGSAQANVDGEPVELEALRTPGSDVTKIVQNYAALSQSLDASPGPPPTMTQSTISGKNVALATDADGDVTVLYAHGDTLWILTSTTDSQNQKILAALQ